MTARHPHRRPAAFTLIELLVVMSIISVLVSILLPSLAGARHRARITKCQANIRELAHATLRYISQHDDIFPLNRDCTADGRCFFWNGHQYFGWNGSEPNPLGNVWQRPVNLELGIEPAPPEGSAVKIARCPSDAGAPGETGREGELFSMLGTSYPLNPILTQGRFAEWRYRNKDIGLSQILQPSLKVLVFDHPAFGLTYDALWTAIRPGWHDRIRPTAVVGFIDGHAEYVTGLCSLREWQWYGEASGPRFTNGLTRKVPWTVHEGCR